MRENEVAIHNLFDCHYWLSLKSVSCHSSQRSLDQNQSAIADAKLRRNNVEHVLDQMNTSTVSRASATAAKTETKRIVTPMHTYAQVCEFCFAQKTLGQCVPALDNRR